MRRLAIVGVFATGCNAAFDLEATTGTHAYFDAPPDAPFSCPGPGETPRFARQLVQVLTQDCSNYTVSQRSGRALAYCKEPARGVYEGAIDGPLAPTSIAAASGRYFDDVRLAADGELAIASDCATAGGDCALVAFRRRADGTWSSAAPTGITLGAALEFSAPSHAPARRLLVVQRSLQRLDEYVEGAGDAWTLATSHPFATGADLLDAQLGADGLRAIGYGRPAAGAAYGALYLDRAAVTEPFAPPRPLAVPPEREVTLTEDCGRVYFTALRSVFYVARE